MIDVDEVLALFVQGFNRWLIARGYELRMTSFALFANIYQAKAETPAELLQARALLEEFFAVGCGELEPAPGAAGALAELDALAQVVILTNAPASARALRGDWLKRHGMDYPMLLGVGPKGPAVRALADRVLGPSLFVDDLLSHLDSVAEAAPAVVRLQMIADPDLRRLAPAAPDRHRQVADWGELLGVGRQIFRA